MIAAVIEIRRLLGVVPPPWSGSFGEHESISPEARAAFSALRPLLVAAALDVDDGEEITLVLDGTIGEHDADWVGYALDTIVAAIAERFAPDLRGSLPDGVRVRWTATAIEFAHALRRAAG